MDQDLLKRVDEWLDAHRSEIIDDLIGLVRIPSVSRADDPVKPFGQDCIDALHYMFRLAEKHGYTWRNYDNTVGSIRFTSGEDEIGIWAHLDVVPVPDPADWVYPPFEGTLVEDRYLIGRGVQDNKAPGMAVFHVMNCLRDLGVPLRHGFSLYMGTSEETGMADARYFAAHYPCPDMSIVPDTGFPVCCAQRGSTVLELSIPMDTPLKFTLSNDISVTPEKITAALPDGRKVTVEGHSAHIFELQDAGLVNVMLKALEDALPESQNGLQTLQKLCASIDGSALDLAFADEMSGALQAAPTSILWEDGRLRVKIFAILPVHCDPDALIEKAQKKAQAAGAELRQLRLRKPVSFSTENPVVGLLTGVYNEVMHQDSKPFVMSGGNYAAYLPNAFGFGPGMPGREFPPHIFKPGHGNYHQCDESEDIEHIMNFMRVYAMSIVALNQIDKLKM